MKVEMKLEYDSSKECTSTQLTEMPNPEQHGSNEKLTLSDWVTFLSGEKASNLANILSVGAFALVAWAGIVAGTVSTTIKGAIIGGGGIFLVFVVWILVSSFERRAKKSGKLLDRILRGDLTNTSQIQEEWKKDKN